MRFCFLLIFGLLSLNAVTANAQGLPANPWAAKQEVINGSVLHISRDNINQQPIGNNASEQSESSSQDMEELKNIAASIKEKWQQRDNQVNDTSASTPEDDKVGTVEAFNAFNTLSKYMQQNNKSDNSNVQNNNSSSFEDFKREIQKMMDKQKTTSSSSDNKISRELGHAKHQYNHYKSQLTSNYNNLKNKAQPVINEVKKGLNEAERTTGMKF